MADYTVDTLNIQVEASANGGIEAMKSLFSSIERVNTALGGMHSNLSKILNIENQIKTNTGKMNSGFVKTSDFLKDATSSANTLKKAIGTVGSTDTKTDGIDNLNNKIKSVEKNSQSIVQTLNKAFNFSVAYYGIKRLTSGISDFMEKSTEFVENYNLFYVSMGSMGNEASQFQNAMNSALGSNISETMRYQGFFNTLGKSLGVASDSASLMSENLTKLTYDLASLYNIDVDTMYNKLSSGIAGQTKPLREIGIDVTQQSLTETAKDLGIDASVQSMDQRNKVLLRYISILQQSTIAQGDMARSIESPANMLKVLSQQTAEATAWIGNGLLKAFGGVITYATGVVMAVKEVAKAFATLMGFTLSDYQFADIDSIDDEYATAYDDLGASADSAADKIKKMTGLFGFDKINNITTPTTSTTTTTGIDNDAIYSKLSTALSGYDNLMGDVSMKAKDIRNSVLDWLGFTYKINEATGELSNLSWGGWSEMSTGAKVLSGVLGGLVAIKVGGWAMTAGSGIKTFLASLAGVKATESLGTIISSLSSAFSAALPVIAGGALSIAGAIGSFVFSNKAATESSKDLSKNLSLTGVSITSFAAGGALIGTAFGPVGTIIGGAIGAVAGLGLAFAGWGIADSIKDVDKFNDVSKETLVVLKPFQSSFEELDRKMKALDWADSIISDTDLSEISSNLDALTTMIKNEIESDLAAAKNQITDLNMYEGLDPNTRNDILNNVEEYYANLQSKADTASAKMKEIYQKASDEHRALTQEEQETVNQLQEDMYTTGIKALSDSQKEQDTILRNMKDNTTQISAKQAAEIVKNSIATRDQIISDAQTQYAEQMRVADDLWDRGVITEDQYDDMKRTAQDGYDEMVKSAEDNHAKILEEAKNHSGKYLNQIDWENGEVKNNFVAAWDNMKISVSEKWNEITTGVGNWFNNDIKPWFTAEKWKGIFNDALSGIKTWWNDTLSWWKTNIKFPSITLPTITWPKIKMPHFSVSGGSWNPIDWIQGKGIPSVNINWYKNGGFPDGENGLFFANNNELVGKFSNGKTAVANNDQITNGIYRAVSEANNSVVDAILSSNGNTTVNVYLDSDQMAPKLMDAIDRTTVITGKRMKTV